MIEVIAEHSVDLALLRPASIILDCGCRGFAFTKAMRDYGHHVWPVDMDLLNEGQAYYQAAIGAEDGTVGIDRCADPQATKMNKAGGKDLIRCYALETITTQFIGEGEVWDLIKLDIEGAEYEVIMAMERPMAKQLSIEFHLHTGIYTQVEMRQMENKLHELGYIAVNHPYTSQHGAGSNYWDSLFILK